MGIVDADIAAGSYTGGVCGYNNGSITGCYSTASVKGASYTGGICGYNDAAGTVSICYNTGTVSGKKYVGGICGYNKNTTINCYNMGAVSGKTTSIGGICGYNKVLVSNCYNAGTVSSGGRNYIGSVCGYNHSASSFQNCYYLITGEEKGNYGVAMTQEQFASGEVCWLLNDGKSKNVVWYQTCGAGFPAFRGKMVYQVRRQKAGGGADEIIVAYTNETEKKQAPTNIVSTEGNNASAEEDYYENNPEVNIKEHIYAKPEWVWQEYDAAKAIFTCQDCGEKITLKASISEKTTEATCAKEGKIVYTASVVRDGETYTDKKTEKLEKSDHQTLKQILMKPAKCEESGISQNCWLCPACGKYFAEQEGKTELSRENVEVPAMGHKYEELKWNWNVNNSPLTASLVFICRNSDCGREEEQKGEVTFKTTATCMDPGKIIYTAVVRFNGQNYKKDETVEGMTIPHSYGEPKWSWKDDYSSADAVFTCAYHCGTTETFTANATRKETDSTCIEEGRIEYTVVVQYNDREFSDTKEIKLPTTDHRYNGPEWSWADDFSTATATFTCTACGTSVSEKAVVKNEGTPETSGTDCGTPGKVIYTASVIFKVDGKEYTDRQEKVLPASHKMTHFVATDPTCVDPGREEYWECSVCHHIFSDKAGSEDTKLAEVPSIPAKGHVLEHVRDDIYHCTACGGNFKVTEEQGQVIIMYSVEDNTVITQNETENSQERQEDSESQSADEQDGEAGQGEPEVQNEEAGQSESEEQNENKSSDAILDVPENVERYGLIYPEGEGEEADPATAEAWEGSTFNLRAESAGKAAAQTVREQQQQQGYPLWVSVAVLAVLAGVVLVLLCKGKVIDDKR